MFHGIIVLKFYFFIATGISLFGLLLLLYFSHKRKQRARKFEGEEVIHRKIEIAGIGQIECDYHVHTYLQRGKWRREAWFETDDGWKFRYFENAWFGCATGTTEWVKIENKTDIRKKLREIAACNKNKKN